MGAKYTDAQKRAYQKYVKSTDELRVRCEKGKKEVIAEVAKARNMTIGEFINLAVDKAIKKALVAEGYQAVKSPFYDGSVEYYKKAAIESKNCSKQWFRYLRKIVTEDGIKLSPFQISMLLSSPDLTMYQKSLLRQAVIPGSETNEKVLALNKKTNLQMIEAVRRKYNVQE